MNAQDIQQFALSDNEKVVRTYECTKLRKLFSPATIGYLTITNNRVVYHSHGKSVTGSSTLLSEIPLDDIAGLSSAVGTSFNWLLFILFSAILYFGTSYLVGILPRFLTSWSVAILLLLPYSISWLFEKEIINQDIREQLAGRLDDLPISGYLKQRDSEFYKRIFYTLFIIGVVLVAWKLAFNTRLTYEVPVVPFALIVGVYFWIYRTFFGKRRAFSLMIASKSAEGSGILIPGNVFSLILGQDNTAMDSLNAGPAADAEIIVKELGAVLTDIRLLGDLGIQKWAK